MPKCVYNSTFLILSWFVCQTFGGVINFDCCLWALSGPEGGRAQFLKMCTMCTIHHNMNISAQNTLNWIFLHEEKKSLGVSRLQLNRNIHLCNQSKLWLFRQRQHWRITKSTQRTLNGWKLKIERTATKFRFLNHCTVIWNILLQLNFTEIQCAQVVFGKSPVEHPYVCDFARLFVILCTFRASLCCLGQLNHMQALWIA